MPSSTDAEVAVAGVFQLLLANSAFLTAVGGAGKIHRDTIPATVTLPAVSISQSGFLPGTRPLQQGGKNTQIWSRGTISVYIGTSPNYNASLKRAILDALDNQVDVVVTGVGRLLWIRNGQEAPDEPVSIGQQNWKLSKINFDVAAKAT